MAILIIPTCSILLAYWVSRVALLLHSTTYEIEETLDADRHPFLLAL